jgi:hypothetical protein
MPVPWQFGLRFPLLEKLISNLSAKTGEKFVVHCGLAANQINLTPDVPLKSIYLNSGKSRTWKLRNAIIQFEHAPTWKLLFGETLEGKLIRALDFLGPLFTQELFPVPKAWETWPVWPRINKNKLV